MIPEFPKFKKLELTDREEIQAFTKQFPPYSDYNFTSMWCWDVREEIRLSKLNDNLIVRFSDYTTGELFYSFLGINNVTETALILLKQSKDEALGEYLKFVPEVTAKEIDKSVLTVEEDRDNFDYIISVEELKPRDETKKKLSTRRRLINQLKSLPYVFIKPIDLGDREIIKAIRGVSLKWECQKNIKNKEIMHLFKALECCIGLGRQQNFLTLGVFANNNLIGYTINELLNDHYALGHFQQANIQFHTGVYSLLMQETAIYLSQLRYNNINLEQDLGILGLRKWKMSYSPINFLKKYVVEK